MRPERKKEEKTELDKNGTLLFDLTGGAVGYTYDTSVYGLTYVVTRDEETGVISAVAPSQRTARPSTAKW